MLVLSRKIGQQIRIGDSVTVSVVRVQGNRVQLSIDAPRSVQIQRNEIRETQFSDTHRSEESAPPASEPFLFEVDAEFLHESA